MFPAVIYLIYIVKMREVDPNLDKTDKILKVL